MKFTIFILFLFTTAIFSGCSRLIFTFEKHYYSLNWYKKLAIRKHGKLSDIPDLKFKGYIKTYVSQQVIDGGPFLEEWGYKFDNIDSQNSITVFLIPSLSSNALSIDTLQFNFKQKRETPEMTLRTSTHFKSECGNLKFNTSQVFNIHGKNYKIYKFCFETLYPEGAIDVNKGYSGTIFYSDQFGVISTRNCYHGFSLELPNKYNGRVLNELKKDIFKDDEFSMPCEYRKNSSK